MVFGVVGLGLVLGVMAVVSVSRRSDDARESTRMRELARSPLTTSPPPGGRIDRVSSSFACDGDEEPFVHVRVTFDVGRAVVAEHYRQLFASMQWSVEPDDQGVSVVARHQTDGGIDGATVSVGEGFANVFVRTTDRRCA